MRPDWRLIYVCRSCAKLLFYEVRYGTLSNILGGMQITDRNAMLTLLVKRPTQCVGLKVLFHLYVNIC
jgi:hypothetical protein